MATYLQLEFKNISPAQSDILVAELSGIGFEGFEEGENSLKAFIPAKDVDEEAVKEIAERNDLSYIRFIIEETNWNAVWESNFEPVLVDDFAGLRAHFHEPIEGVEHEIVITPKMSFGTGHHATTFMMIQQMREIDFKEKKVLDFGTGTGILAILAEQLGASKIIAIDNDDWSIENAAENIARNHCDKISLKKAGTAEINEKFDVIIANINKNVILDNLSVLVHQLADKGVLLLSGLLSDDEAAIIPALKAFQLQPGKKTEKNNWISLRFNH